MKLIIELDESLQDIEVTIKTPAFNENFSNLQKAIEMSTKQTLKYVFYKENSEYYIPISDILFFETQDNIVCAHTEKDTYTTKLKLYEIESSMPFDFIRISKSTIVNTKKIHALNKSFSGTSTISFYKTHKQVHVSRHYYKALKDRLNETR
ncbi:LytTR family transcriptional regulator [Carnobacteriaceae bacterium zg-C25]|nr:LytTR family transcriptional regulator [Carnobacteriaceae bacterium zg-ZUI240]QTU83290.1 LytTR family transcriptional regulator [Carnobacteriaceae bacterium zg-C25]